MIGAVIERLKAEAPSLASVDPAEELEAISRGTAPRNGACFVCPFEDRPEPSPIMSGGFRQRIEVLFLVAFVIRRADDAKGSKRAGSFDGFRNEIEAALFGWAPDDDNDPIELVAARSAAMGNGVTIYVQTWRTSRYLSAD